MWCSILSFPGKAAVISVLSLDTNLRSLLPFVESTGKCITLSRAFKHFIFKRYCLYRLADWLIKIWLSFNSLLYVGVFWCSILWCSLFLSAMHMYCMLHLHCFMKCSRSGIFYYQCMWYYQYLFWARTISNFVTIDANLCVSQTSLVLVYFAFWLGDAKDDAKLKKCVSTRYATVLILLTVKCEFYYKKILSNGFSM